MKPRIRKDRAGWVCKRRGTSNGYGRTPALAYIAWKLLNQMPPQQVQAGWSGYFGDAGGPLR